MRDRTYYRCLSADELIAQGRDSAHELCIALADRLDDTTALEAQLADQQETIDDLKHEISDLVAKLYELYQQEGQPK